MKHMIVWHRFGYALRHRIYYETRIKQGNVKLWSSHSGAMTGADPTANADNFISELEALHGVFNDGFLGTNNYTEFQIGGEKDILSLLASLIVVKQGRECSFSNYEDRKISLSAAIEGIAKKLIITLQIQYGKPGKLTLDEANNLEAFTKEILIKLGLSDNEISERIQKLAGV